MHIQTFYLGNSIKSEPSYSIEFSLWVRMPMFLFFCHSCEDRCPFHTRTCANGKPACAKHCRFPKEKRAAAHGLQGQENPWSCFVPKTRIPVISNSILLAKLLSLLLFPKILEDTSIYLRLWRLQNPSPALNTSQGFSDSLAGVSWRKKHLHTKEKRKHTHTFFWRIRKFDHFGQTGAMWSITQSKWGICLVTVPLAICSSFLQSLMYMIALRFWLLSCL